MLKAALPVAVFLMFTASYPLFAGVPAETHDVQDAAAMDYLVQKVCTDASGKVLAIDPYACPKTATLRPLQVGELLPYHKYDQPHQQQHDSYPVRDLEGKLLVINPFNYAPFDHFKPWGDGYDIYVLRDGWTSVGDTKDGGGFSTTFFGRGCTPYNGWVFFPVSIFGKGEIEAGEANIPITSNYWEQNGQSWPGVCPKYFSSKSGTRWEFIRQYPFGGIGGNPVKPIDTIRSIHGFTDSEAFVRRGHLEVFYFTKPYGITRWEVWTPKEQVEADRKLSRQAQGASRACRDSGNTKFHGHDFVVTSCRDWSSVEVLAAPEAPAFWPVPGMNLLQNFHFGDGLKGWVRSGKDASPIEWELKNSTAPLDNAHVQASVHGAGVRYLAFSCREKCAENAGIYQDIPVSDKTGNGTYTIGATVRAEEGLGTVKLTLLELDQNGKIFAEVSHEATVSAQGNRFSGQQSIVLSSTFISKSVPLAIHPKARFLRVMVSPESNGTFDLVDVWLVRN